ncbi:chaplin family protein [Streptomyces silvensis]|uniref:chaplin family protein n=1 Tax=Streptomyces silvensis TaxID=1765722 RepID=UPI000ABD2814|nr:chaplin family protein [Streptomyces silvensis]
MTQRSVRAVLVLAAASGTGFAGVAPAAAGGVGDVLSPAFGTSCANRHGAHAVGTATHGSGSGDGNLLGLPVGSPLNQCGGADLPAPDFTVAPTASFDVCETAEELGPVGLTKVGLAVAAGLCK